MIRSKIQIENGEVQDFYDAFGFIYIDADERTAAPEKEDAVTSYAEQAGENRDGRTVKAPFDYTAKFIVEARNGDLAGVNTKVSAFNRAVRKMTIDSDVVIKREIAFYNLINNVKIVGTCEPISEPTEVWHSNIYGELDFAEISLKMRVSNPNKCDFELNTDNL